VPEYRGYKIELVHDGSDCVVTILPLAPIFQFSGSFLFTPWLFQREPLSMKQSAGLTASYPASDYRRASASGAHLWNSRPSCALL
jgi:hypothetical protein